MTTLRIQRTRTVRGTVVVRPLQRSEMDSELRAVPIGTGEAERSHSSAGSLIAKAFSRRSARSRNLPGVTQPSNGSVAYEQHIGDVPSGSQLVGIDQTLMAYAGTADIRPSNRS